MQHKNIKLTFLLRKFLSKTELPEKELEVVSFYQDKLEIDCVCEITVKILTKHKRKLIEKLRVFDKSFERLNRVDINHTKTILLKKLKNRPEHKLFS